MNIMRKKLGKNGGFTLVEMLIVVAIIAILIAVSIPLVTDALEKARDATDLANERAAKAAASLVYLEVVEDEDFEKKDALIGIAGLDYDAVNGTLSVDAFGGEPYGKCTGTRNSCGDQAWLSTNGGQSHEDMWIRIWYAEDTGIYTITWVS